MDRVAEVCVVAQRPAPSPIRALYIVVGLAPEAQLTKFGKGVPIRSLVEVRRTGVGYLVFEKVDIHGRRAKVVASNSDKDLTLFIDSAQRRNRWQVEWSSAREQGLSRPLLLGTYVSHVAATYTSPTAWSTRSRPCRTAGRSAGR